MQGIINNQVNRKIVICRKSRKFGTQMFLVEIYIQEELLVIQLENVKLLQRFQYLLQEKQGLAFLREQYKNNIEILVNDIVQLSEDEFKIKGTDMVLIPVDESSSLQEEAKRISSQGEPRATHENRHSQGS